MVSVLTVTLSCDRRFYYVHTQTKPRYHQGILFFSQVFASTVSQYLQPDLFCLLVGCVTIHGSNNNYAHFLAQVK